MVFGWVPSRRELRKDASPRVMSMSAKPANSLAAVVGTRNRLSLLKSCVAALRAQTHPLNAIIVVDNDSTDGTREWLAGQRDLQVITQPNSGGAGGQYTGMKTAYLQGHDWFWCMDDDTEPNRDALEELVKSPRFSDPQTGFLASLVLWTDGTPHRMNTPEPSHHWEWYHTVLTDKCIRVSVSSFVSILISRAAVAKVGLPIKEFFIWRDDVEYTERVGEHFHNYLVLSSRVLHNTKVHTGGVWPARIEPHEYTKYCYGVRNEVALIKMRKLPRYRKVIRFIGLLNRYLPMILTGRAPVRLLGWIWRGLWFRPKPDMV